MKAPDGFRWGMGATVRKKRGSAWHGHVCGFYSTANTPEGYCVESAFEPGSVQVWPVTALEDWWMSASELATIIALAKP